MQAGQADFHPEDYYEYYNWNSFKNDWQGEDRSEFCNDDNYRMRAYYEWDDDDWMEKRAAGLRSGPRTPPRSA